MAATKQSTVACAGFERAQRMSRRDLLTVGSAAGLGLTLPGLLRAEAAVKASAKAGHQPTAKSVIFLFQWGGPSHLETFDMKPEGPPHSKGEFKPIPSNVPGVQVCELLPRFAQVMDKVSLIRSMSHRFGTHNAPGYYALTGHAPPVDDIRLRESPDLYPNYGAVIDYLHPAPPQVPSWVSMPARIRDGSYTPGQYASFLGKAHDPLLILNDPNKPDFSLPELSLPAGLSVARLQKRRALLNRIDKQVGLLEKSAEARGVADYQERAFAMLSSPQVKRAFDIGQESDKTRDAYGRTTFGQGCLLARRLIEIGVRIVTVYYCRSSGGFIWDTHKKNFPELKDKLLPTTDLALPTLLSDLDERGMLDDTLVVWTGEFGRTPKINKNAGRDHWPRCYSMIMAGGGMKRGFVYGASDERGAYPTENPLKPENIAGTIYHALGLDPHYHLYDLLNRPLPIGGDPVLDLFA